jgi:hypothetical protein
MVRHGLIGRDSLVIALPVGNSTVPANPTKNVIK